MKLGQLHLTAESAMASAVDDADINNDLNPESAEHSALGEDEVTGNDEAAALDEQAQEIQSTDQALDGQDQSLNTAFNAADELNEIQAAAQNMAAQGGALSPASASIVETTMESIMKRLGIEPVAFPTVEAYSSTYGRRDATRLTMEGLADASKRAWDRLIAMLKELMSSVLGFLERAFQNRALLEKRILQLKARAKNIQSDWSRKSETVRGPFVRALTFRAEASEDTTWDIINTSRALAGGFGLGVKTINEIRDSKIPGDAADIRILKDFMETALRGNLQFSVKDGSEYTELFGALPNGMSLGFRESLGPDAIYYHTNRGKTVETPSEMEALDDSAITPLLNAGLDVLRQLKDLESRSGGLVDAVRGVIRNLENEYARLRSAMGSEDHTKRYAAQRRARAVQTILTKIIGRFPSTIFMSVKHTADYCEASIRNFTPERK